MTAKTLTGFWGGTYSYRGPRPAPVPFDAELRQHGAALSGRTTEPNTFSREPTAVLGAYLEGMASGGQVVFTKTYDGEGAIHAVRYEGTLDEDDLVITGRWSVGGDEGTFLMRRDPGSLAEEAKTAQTDA